MEFGKDTAQNNLLMTIFLEYLERQFDNYPYSEHKDSLYFSRLLGEFSELNIFEELKQYHAWILDQPEEKKIYYRSRFRTWLKTARGFKLNSHHHPYWMRYAQSR